MLKTGKCYSDDSYHSEQEDNLMTYYKRACNIVNTTFPTVVKCLLLRTQNMVNTALMGHYNDPAILSGAGLGSVCMNFMGWAIIVGFNTVIDSLVPQQAARGNLQECGVLLNKSRLIITVMFLPIALICTQTKEILYLLG